MAEQPDDSIAADEPAGEPGRGGERGADAGPETGSKGGAEGEAGRPKAKAKARRVHSTQWRVRAAVYLTFLLVAALAALEAWNSVSMNERAHREAALQQRVTEARVEAYELAQQAAAVLTQPSQRERALTLLGRRVGHAAAAMPVIEQMLGRELADPEVRKRFDAWKLAHEKLRERLSGFVGPGIPGEPEAVEAAMRAVSAEAEAAATSAESLAETLAGMHKRSTSRAETIVWAQVGLLVLMLLLLALLVIEPMVRSVDRRMASARTLAGPLRRLALVPEVTSSLVLITDRHDRIRWSNAAFTQLVGWRYDEVRHGLPAEVLRHPEADAEALRALREAVAQGRPLRQQSLHRRKDGSDLWLDLELKPLRDGTGKVRGYMYLGSDITERVAEQARMRLQWLALPVGVLVHAPDGLVVDANREAERLLGTTRDELVGRRLPDNGWRFVRGDLTLCQSADLPAERTLRERMPLIGEVLGLRQADGGLRWLLVNSQLQIGMGGAVTEVLVSLADITGRFEATRARPVAVA
ncbi:MAG: PAS domain-containing protein [Rubrivivax sp.]|nr:PAS domain-containing protein [Rubrivivax sp.]